MSSVAFITYFPKEGNPFRSSGSRILPQLLTRSFTACSDISASLGSVPRYSLRFTRRSTCCGVGLSSCNIIVYRVRRDKQRPQYCSSVTGKKSLFCYGLRLVNSISCSRLAKVNEKRLNMINFSQQMTRYISKEIYLDKNLKSMVGTVQYRPARFV